MSTPGEFTIWKAEIKVELADARARLAEAVTVQVAAEKNLARVIQKREQLLAALKPLTVPVFDERRNVHLTPDLATSLGRRARDQDQGVREAETAVFRAGVPVDAITAEISDLELAQRQLEQLTLHGAHPTAEAAD